MLLDAGIWLRRWPVLSTNKDIGTNKAELACMEQPVVDSVFREGHVRMVCGYGSCGYGLWTCPPQSTTSGTLTGGSFALCKRCLTGRSGRACSISSVVSN